MSLSLIVLCGGSIKDSFGNIKPLKSFGKYKTLLEANIASLLDSKFDNVIVTITDSSLFDSFSNVVCDIQTRIKSKITLVVLPFDTSGPAETLYQTLKRQTISGPIVVKDCDTLTIVPKPFTGNCVSGIDVGTLKMPIISKKASYLVVSNSRILDIVEQDIKSTIISTGIYSFISALEFCQAYEFLINSFYRHNASLYISHIISFLIGAKKMVFRYLKSTYFYEGDTYEEKKGLTIVDLDGTLVDTFYTNYYSYNKALNEYGLRLSEEDFRRVYGLKYDYFLPNLFPTLDHVAIKEIHNKKKLLYKSFLNKAIVNVQLVELLLLMKKDYFVVCCTTASHENAKQVLETFNISFFDEIQTQEDVDKPKPNLECYYKLMNKYRTNFSNTIIFEDGNVGLEVANSFPGLVFLTHFNHE